MKEGQKLVNLAVLNVLRQALSRGSHYPYSVSLHILLFPQEENAFLHTQRGLSHFVVMK